ncbi:hypothetical protein Tdes44962_MAKER02775, partial [Teratosphaeria destructans]
MAAYDGDYDRMPRRNREYGDLPPPPPGPPPSNLGGEPMPNERRPRQARFNSKDSNLPPPPMGDALNGRPSAMKREGSRSRVPPDVRPEFPDEASYLGPTAPDLERKNRRKDREFRDKRDGYESEEGEMLRNQKPRRSPRPPPPEDVGYPPRRPHGRERPRDDLYDMPPPPGAIPVGGASRNGHPPPGAIPIEPHRRGPDGDRPRRRDRDFPEDDLPPRRRRDDDYDARPRRRRDDYDDYDDPPPRRPRDRPVEYGSDPIPVRRRNTDVDRSSRPSRRREYDDYSDDDLPPPRRHRSQVDRRPRRDPYDDRYYDSDDRDRRRPGRDDRDRRRYSDEYDDYDRRDRRGDPARSIKIGDFDIGPMLEKGQKHYATVAPIVTPFIINAAKNLVAFVLLKGSNYPLGLGNDLGLAPFPSGAVPLHVLRLSRVVGPTSHRRSQRPTMASYTYEFIELGDDVDGLGCRCCRFKNGLDLPTPKRLCTAEIQQLGLQFSTSIIEDWEQLNGAIRRFESVIQKRWLKKSVRQRKELLLTAWPNMSKEHRPDFAALRNVKKAAYAPRSRTIPSAAYLWPYINLEDLVQPNPMVLFLSSRGREFPDAFMAGDIGNAHLGKGWLSELPPSGLIMQFDSQRTPRSYGRLIDVASTPKRSSFACDPNMGLLGLEIQAGIYDFLLKCTRLILHDIPPPQLRLAPHQPQPALPVARTRQWLSLTEQMREAPYRAPQELDFERLRELVASRRASAEDHVWLLREDPAYFIDALKETVEHDYQLLRRRSDDDIWGAAACDLVGEALTCLIYWHRIHELLQQLPPLESQLRQACPHTSRLSSAHEKIWAELDELTSILPYDLSIPRLLLGFPSSPRLRHCYPVATATTSTNSETRVDNLFRAVTCDREEGLHPIHLCVQEAQYMLDTDPESSSLLDPWVLGHFEDLALLSELHQRISSFKPWSSGWRSSEINESESVMDGLASLLHLEEKLILTLKAASAYPLEAPSSVCWQYPADKTPTEERVDQMRRAEDHLDRFWEGTEELVMLISGLELSQVLKERTLQPRHLARTPPWVQPTRQAVPKPASPAESLAVGGRPIHPPTEPKTSPTSQQPKTK